MSTPEPNKQQDQSQGKYHPVTHVVFDCDGLLVDSEQYYYIACRTVCKKLGKDFTYDTKCAMMGTKPLEGAQIAIERLGLLDKISPEEFVQQYQEEMKHNCPNIKLMPGAERLIRHLEEHKIPIAIATGSDNCGFERKTGHLGEILRKPFSHHVFAGSDPEVKRGKPHPDVFKIAAARFKPPPESPKHVLVFEDAINGVNAALEAGMQVIFVPDKWVDLKTISAKPTETLKDLNDFRPELYGLPPWDHPEKRF